MTKYFLDQVKHGKPATEQAHVLRLYRAARRHVSSSARDTFVTRYTAQQALADSRATVAHVKATGHTNRIPHYIPDGIWSRGAANGVQSVQYGTRGRWISSPDSVGLRLVGVSGDLLKGRDVATGYYLDANCDETVKGVVYQLPSRGGVVRYLAGYADPWNCDDDGTGPAWLESAVYSGPASDSTWDTPDAQDTAARAADHIAERMADDSREHDNAHHAGQTARAATLRTLAAAKGYTQAVRATFAVFKHRRALGKDAALLFRAQIEQARDRCDELRTAREESHVELNDAPDPKHDAALALSWRDGYGAGAG
jgi:hypothetical protein